jgi:HlyD family secretion protein
MAQNEMNTGNDINQILGVGRHTNKRPQLHWLWTALLLVLLATAAYLWLLPAEGPAFNFDTAEIVRGNMTVTVTATGTVQPVNQVDVGSELSGTIESVHVDFNDQVQRGQVLARLDTDRLHAQVIESRASLESAKARVAEARATVVETRLRFERCEKLVPRQLCSREELETTRAASARARALEASARAQVEVANATLEAHETDLAKAEIKSPVDGLVLRRQIEPGQTVAASLQAPVLFTLAEDLAHMELHVAVDEADVGKIGDGQSAEFTVDAYPDRSFSARITQVRFAPQTIEGVVTYETILSVDNSDLALRPGMTATAVITVQQLNDILLVPNAALRFTPPASKTSQRRGGGVFGMLFRRPSSSRRKADTNGSKGQKVWVLQNGQPSMIPIKTGASDGKFTELMSAELQAGQEVIIDAVSVKK